ncbi:MULTISPECIES: HlyD family efflux transporter periplasmic adaptor subunit [unclassified Luteibacter]|uniref:efflux RND transporter periplasmic adaptor subunit n=1 Tax=unclassified Luteibacter TaxID=2620188 RepID=UPI0008D4BE0B|nr:MULTISPECIES: HlyD family efflux transporter periplasmic adaptor subunit [unclassified Luteibacter]MDR6937581.1 membrane fusion protein (multidrug efflux system) [Luteibacter sp. 3190]SEO36719.1 membrane fusion protein, multidrug efflux system [Luteibacter sp. UNC138MFCol5.1]SEW23255.1 membrane fusion protein, multidrug efflux system [Luteibacter sp. 329MFSha]
MSQENTAPAGAVVAPPPKSRRGFFLKLLVAVIVLAGIGWTVWYFVDGRWYEDTDDAYVNGNVVQITPQIAATVLSITADDGDLVHKGDVLVKLDNADAQIALLSARADLANTVRRVRGLYNNVTSAQADVAVRQTAVDRARADYNRRRDLAKSGAISAEELSHALDTLTSAESSLASAKQSYSTSKVLVDDTVVASHPDVRAAAAKLRSAYLDEARTTIVAPVDGYVAKRSVQLGQRVQPGAALMAVVPLHEVWIDANFKETQLTHMRIGQPVDVTADVYGSDVVYKAKIRSLGIGSGSAFSLLPAQNATGNWIKIVQRVPVRVVFTDPKQLDAKPLRLGLSTKVTVSLHDQNGALLAQQPPAKPEFATDVYDHRLDGVDAEIAKVIHENAAAGEGEQEKAPK